jgi:pentapeptide MXKDX repeat protein
MKRNLVVCAIVSGVLAGGGALRAQSAADVPQLMMRATYTGCLQSVNHDAWFVLTNAMIDESGSPVAKQKVKPMNDAMQHDSRHRDPMGGDPMKNDAMKNDAMKNDAMKNDAMKNDAMTSGSAPMTLDLRSKALNFRKHTGHEVRITGYGPQPEIVSGTTVQAFSVTTVKTLGKTCQ